MTFGPSYYNAIFRTKARYRVSWRATKQAHLFEQARAFVPPRAAVLEVGCGTGQFAECLAEQCQASYLGLDFSGEAIRQAIKHCPKMCFECRDVTTNPPAFDGWDLVVALEVLEHLPDDLAFLRMLPAGMPMVVSLPTFGGPGHFRHFKTPLSVVTYYTDVLTFSRLDSVDNPARPGTFPWLLGQAMRS